MRLLAVGPDEHEYGLDAFGHGHWRFHWQSVTNFAASWYQAGGPPEVQYFVAAWPNKFGPGNVYYFRQDTSD